ncbi:MAG: SIMPL domain-containing protein [Fimbriimonadales bacterium]
MTLVMAGSIASAQGDRQQLPLLTVMGSAEVKTAPDQATVGIGVMTQAPNARDAQEKANVIIQKFLAEMQRLGIDKKDVQTSRLMLNPMYDNPKPGEPMRISGYQAQNVLSVRVENFDLIGKVVDAGVSSGANTVENIGFAMKDDTRVRLEALREAAAEARQKAEVMAQALGIELGGVFEVVEGGAQVMPPPMYRGEAFAAMKADTPVEPGQVTITASLTVRYEIRKR